MKLRNLVLAVLIAAGLSLAIAHSASASDECVLEINGVCVLYISS